jgi:hypothetical protein
VESSGDVPPFPILIVNLAVAAALLFLALVMRPPQRRASGAAAVGALPLASAALLVLFVLSDDTYRDDGTSRWDAYTKEGGALGALFFASVAVMAACGALLVYAALRGRGLLFRSVALVAGIAALLLLTPTIVGFSTN